MPKRPLEDGLSDRDKMLMHRDPTVPWPFELSTASCPMCGGRGSVMESIDAERWPVPVPCDRCRRWCAACKKYVPKAGHECPGGEHAQTKR